MNYWPGFVDALSTLLLIVNCALSLVYRRMLARAGHA